MPDLDPLIKKPFVRFLLWVYMTTAGDKMQAGSAVLQHDSYVIMLFIDKVLNIRLCELL